MSPEEIKRMRQINFKQTNAFAMQHGLILGAVGIATLAAFIAGQSLPLFGSLHLLLVLCTPLLAVWLTARFRRQVAPGFPFSFSRGFAHTLLAFLYAGIWTGVGTFVYFYFLDQGHLFDTLQAQLSRPEQVEAMRQSGLDEWIKTSTGGLTFTQVIDELRKVSAATYAAMVIYSYILTAPLVAIFGGLFNIRRASAPPLSR